MTTALSRDPREGLICARAACREMRRLSRQTPRPCTLLARFWTKRAGS